MRGVYVIQAGQEALVRIGYHEAIEQYLAALQAKQQERLTVLIVWEDATQEEARQLQASLRLWYIGGEWFDWNPTVERVLREFQQQHPTVAVPGRVALQTFTLREGRSRKSLTKIVYKHRDAVDVQELGRLLEYGRLGQDLEDLVLGAWSLEFQEGTHYELLRDQDFQDFLELSGYRASNPFKPSLMLLYQPGIDLVLLKSTGAAGVATRTWLVTEVFPDLRRQAASERSRQAFRPDPHKAILMPLLHEKPVIVFLSKDFSQQLQVKGATSDLDYGLGWNALHRTYFRMTANQIKELAQRQGLTVKGKSARTLAYELAELRAAHLRQSSAIDYRRILPNVPAPKIDAVFTSPEAVHFYDELKQLGGDLGSLPSAEG